MSVQNWYSWKFSHSLIPLLLFSKSIFPNILVQSFWHFQGWVALLNMAREFCDGSKFAPPLLLYTRWLLSFRSLPYSVMTILNAFHLWHTFHFKPPSLRKWGEREFLHLFFSSFNVIFSSCKYGDEPAPCEQLASKCAADHSLGIIYQ